MTSPVSDTQTQILQGFSKTVTRVAKLGPRSDFATDSEMLIDITHTQRRSKLLKLGVTVTGHVTWELVNVCCTATPVANNNQLTISFTNR